MVQVEVQKFRRWPWIIVIILLAVFIPAHAIVQSQYQQTLDAWARQWHLNSAALVRANHVWLISSHPSRAPLDLAFAKSNLGGRSFEPIAGKSNEILWTDADGGQATLFFPNNLWVRNNPAPLEVPRPKGLAAAVLLFRQLVYLGLFLLWPILALIWAAQWPRTTAQRTHWALHLLLISTTATLLAMLGPQYWRAWSSFFHDDFAAWGFLQIALSLLALFVSRFIQLRNDGLPRCRQCRYILTGNTSGICPECGTPVPGTLQKAITPIGK